MWDYSPRQAYAFLVLIEHSKRENDARDMGNTHIGNNADGKKLDEVRKDLLKGF